jgi:predicted Zn-ribbon and HTH transcriptional regulator
MKAVDRCPACDSHSFQPFSFTVESERNGAMHFAQTRCRDCDLVFANPVAEPDESRALLSC